MLLKIIRALLAIYRLWIAPALHLVGGPGMGCRFTPTCSQYCLEAFQKHGSMKGFILTLRRLSRCHPLSRSGYDPVPNSNAQIIQGR